VCMFPCCGPPVRAAMASYALHMLCCRLAWLAYPSAASGSPGHRRVRALTLAIAYWV